jgi:hypothetical protein
VAYVNAAEVARSGVLRAGDRIEYSIRLGGAAVAVTLATEPQADDRHLLDGVAKASDRTAEDAAGSLMAGIIARGDGLNRWACVSSAESAARPAC